MCATLFRIGRAGTVLIQNLSHQIVSANTNARKIYYHLQKIQFLSFQIHLGKSKMTQSQEIKYSIGKNLKSTSIRLNFDSWGLD
jgi:hypothetical protein